jgi:hypothetical protein
MITALATQHKTHIAMEIIYPGKAPKQFATAANTGEAKRLVYFHNRKYIIEKLSSWFSQRMYCRDKFHVPVIKEAAELKVLLASYKDTSLHNLCKVVADHSAAIWSVAPGKQSGHRAYFESTIIPIINFCEYMKGGNDE